MAAHHVEDGLQLLCERVELLEGRRFTATGGMQPTAQDLRHVQALVATALRCSLYLRTPVGRDTSWALRYRVQSNLARYRLT